MEELKITKRTEPVMFTIRVDKSIVDFYDDLAQKTNRSRNELIALRWNMPKIKSKSSRNTFIHIKRAAAGKKIPNCGSSVNLVFITLFKSSAQIGRIFNLQMLPHPLPFIQPHLISYHRNELRVGSLPRRLWMV